MHGVRHLSPDTLGEGETVVTSNQMIRIRRQMHRRIREVVAERRLARQGAPLNGPVADLVEVEAESRSQQNDKVLIGSE
ncbi:MAG TPA: hypothetical protein VGD43_02635 [Micromonospora sp.]